MKETVKIFLLVVILFTHPYCMGASEFKDPTRPPDAFGSANQPELANQLRLSAIFIYPNYRIALINGQKVMPGDKIGDYVVSSIKQNTVELTSSDDTVTVLSISTSIKKRSN